MRARLLLNLGLAVLIAALAAVVWLRPGQEQSPGPEPLTALEPDTVSRIEITPPRGEPFVLERAQGAWEVAQPVRVPARQYRVDSLLGLATTPKRAALPASAPGEGGSDGPADFGLDPPEGRVKLDALEIAFGDSNPVDYRRYVALGGTVYLIDDGYFHHVATTWADWVDLRLIPAGATLERIVTPSYALARTPQDSLALEPPVAGVSADAIARRADDWLHVQALEAHAGATPPADATELAVTFRAEGAQQPTTLRYALERTAGAVRLHRRDLPLAYELALGEADRLLAPPPPDVPVAAGPGATPADAPAPADAPPSPPDRAAPAD